MYMPKKRRSKNRTYIIVALLCVVIGVAAIYLYVNYFGGVSTDVLKITQYQQRFVVKEQIEGGDYIWTWEVSIRIANRGDSNVSEAELVVELIAEQQTIDSTSDTFNLPAGWATTEYLYIRARESELIDKRVGCVVTIYLGGKVLDQYYTSWG
jgi:hypothetical protein